MADIVYYESKIDGNGEVQFRKVQAEAAFNSARLHVQRIEEHPRVVKVDHPRTDPTLAEFYEPQPRDSEQGDG